MVYTSESPLKLSRDSKLNKKVSKVVLSDKGKLRLKKHKEGHIKNGNDTKMINKHMKVMRDLLKQNKSFRFSHSKAQEKYPMGNKTDKGESKKDTTNISKILNSKGELDVKKANKIKEQLLKTDPSNPLIKEILILESLR